MDTNNLTTQELLKLAKELKLNERPVKENFYSSDPFVTTSKWIKETELDAGMCMVVPQKLYENFCAWMKTKNVEIPTMTAFGRALREKLPKKRTNRGIRYLLNRGM